MKMGWCRAYFSLKSSRKSKRDGDDEAAGAALQSSPSCFVLSLPFLPFEVTVADVAVMVDVRAVIVVGGVSAVDDVPAVVVAIMRKNHAMVMMQNCCRLILTLS
jgi:hypothetical protein